MDGSRNGVMIFIGIVFLLFMLVVAVSVCEFLAGCLKAIPPGFRKMPPGQVWLLLIPVFHIVWAMVAYPKIADSFKAYLEAEGCAGVEDCGRTTAVLFACGGAISFMLAILTYILPAGFLFAVLNLPLSLAVLGLWIYVLVKFAGLRKLVVSRGR